MTVGIDLGTTEFRSIRRVENEVVSTRCPASYLVVPDSVAHRRLLSQSQTSFVVIPDQLVVLGEMVTEWSNVFQVPVRPLLPHGELPKDDPLARQLLSIVFDSVLPPAAQPGETCGLVPSGSLRLANRTPSRETAFFSHLAELKGYSTVTLSAAYALSLAELVVETFCGLSVVIGSSAIDFVLVHSSEVLGQSLIHRGWDDSPVADVDRLSTDAGRAATAEFLTGLFDEAQRELRHRRAFPHMRQPVTLVVGGAFASSEYEPLIRMAFESTDWPLQICRIHFSRDTRMAIARGALIEAELSQPVSSAA